MDNKSESEKINKRENYINWDDYFMFLAKLSAERSKDPSTQVGACIVNNENKIISIGYNGFPNQKKEEKSIDNILPWCKDDKCYSKNKYAYVCHAEMNAIMNSNICLKDTIIYVTLFPCNECAKLIIQAGIKKVVYLSDKYKETESVKASKIMFDLLKIEYIPLDYKTESITLSFN